MVILGRHEPKAANSSATDSRQNRPVPNVALPDKQNIATASKGNY